MTSLVLSVFEESKGNDCRGIYNKTNIGVGFRTLVGQDLMGRALLGQTFGPPWALMDRTLMGWVFMGRALTG